MASLQEFHPTKNRKESDKALCGGRARLPAQVSFSN